MIGKAALAIKQINNLIEELQNIKNPDLEVKKTQIHEISKTIQNIERSGIEVPKDLIIVKERLQTELKEFDNPDDVLLLIADELSKSIDLIYAYHSFNNRNFSRSIINKKRRNLDVNDTSSNYRSDSDVSDEKILYIVNKQIIAFSFMGVRHPVKFWIDVLLEMAQILSSQHKSQFNSVLQLRGTKMLYFSENPRDLVSPRKIEGTEIYLDTKLSATRIIVVTKRLMALFGHSEDELILEYQ